MTHHPPPCPPGTARATLALYTGTAPDRRSRNAMGDRTDPDHGRRRRRGRVLSGGPRDPRLGPASHFWVADPDRTSGPSRLAPADSGVATGPHPGRLAAPPPADPARLRPSLVAYPLRLRRPSPQLVRWTVLGGLGDLGAGEALEGFRPSPDLVFVLGVELVGRDAQRLGYAAASTTVHPGPPDHCRHPRLVCLVGTAPRAALAELGEHLLWKEAWSLRCLLSCDCSPSTPCPTPPPKCGPNQKNV